MQHNTKILAGIQGCLWSLMVFAVPSSSANSNNLPISVTSQSATANLQQGTVIYSGSVQAVQGTRKLEGDTLTIQRGPDGNIQSFKAEGNPAKTQEQPSAGGQMAYGQAETIYFLPQQNLVKYLNHAKFTQGGNVFSGDVITYNTVTQVVSSPKVQGGTGVTTIILPAYTQGKSNS